MPILERPEGRLYYDVTDIAPDDSPFVSVESNVERLRAIPGARLQVIAGSRHGVAFSRGAQCAGV